MSDARFVRKGNKVIVKEEIKPVELDAKAVLMTIDNSVSALERQLDQLKQMEEQKVKLMESNAKIDEQIKKLRKHEDWATEVQESKMRSVVDEVKDECVKKLDDYEYDDTLTEEQNKAQKYHMYVSYIQRHEKVQNALSMRFLNKIKTKSFIDNPF